MAHLATPEQRVTSPQDRKNPHVLVSIAAKGLAEGNLPFAWNLGSELRVFNLATRQAYTLLGRVAEAVGVFDLAIEHYAAAMDLSPRDKGAAQDLARAQGLAARFGPRAIVGGVAEGGGAEGGAGGSGGVASLKRRHVIRAWGFGFCSELDNVLGQILLADIMGREPVVWWGKSSIFRDSTAEDAWSHFFMPVGDIDRLKATLATHGLDNGVVFPPKWIAEVASAAGVAGVVSGPPRNITGGAWSRMGSAYFVTRGEAITVGDYFIAPIEAHTWAPEGHWSRGKHIDEVYRVLVERYIRLQPEVARLVDDLARQMELGAADRPVLAVHVRESDKVLEDKDIADWNAQVLERAKAQASADPRLRVLLITDSEPAVARYHAALPGRVLTVDTVRTSNATGVHAPDLSTGTMYDDRRRLGVEVVRDIYLASRCERFMGVGSSNVAAMIAHLRDWPKDACVLVGQNMHHQINAFIHEWNA